MNDEIKFLVKIGRNALILSGMYFVSVFATGDLCYKVLKPIIIFFLTYVFSELARRYRLNPNTRVKIRPLVF